MNTPDLLRFTVRSVRSHGMRSLLTALGIGVGVAAVVVLTSLGEGLHQFMASAFSQFGTNVIAINPGKPNTMGLSPGVINSARPLTIADGEALARIPQVRSWIPSYGGVSEVEGNGRQKQAMVFGVGPDAPDYFGYAPAIGQFLPRDDPQSPRPVAVLGNGLRKDLYGDANPLGERVRVGGSRFRVVGVMEEKGSFLGINLDDVIFLPAARVLELYNQNGLQEIDLKHDDGADVDEIVRSVRRVLIARHGHEDFSVMTQQQMTEVMDSVLGVLKLGVAALGSISLLVGGVGIFTIMTIAVRERTPEIGLLRAVGATRAQIQGLFLSESVVLGAFGGILGLAGGLIVAAGLAALVPGLPVQLSIAYVIAAEAVAVIIGLAAGVLPAHRAAGLEPLDALRAE